MLFSDYHSHPQGHRVQPYTQDLLQPWVESARQEGLTDIAFTDHDRYCAGVSFDEIERLRENNPDIKIRAGIELDNDPVHSAAGRKWVEENWACLDFVLGSVHFLERDDEMFDSVPAGAAQFEGKNIDAIYADYFRRIREMAASGLIDCLAHIDLIKIHGHRSKGEVVAMMDETLDFIRARNLAKGIPFTTASDAHSHVQLGEGFDRLAEKMSALGVREISVFEKHKRQTRVICTL
jgi:histidinol-phosphatase (PHP family)